MKISNKIIIFLGFVLWVEFVGGVVYRTLINDNDNSRKEVQGPQINDNVDKLEAVDEGIGLIIEIISGIDMNQVPKQDDSSKEAEADKSTRQNTRVSGKLCTCVEQADSGNSEQDTQSENHETQNNGEQGNIEDTTITSDLDGSNGEADNVEATNGSSGDQGGIGKVPVSETSIEEQEENGDQDDMDKNRGSSVYEGISTFKFSPLDR